MGYRERIDNCVVVGSKLGTIKKVFYEKFSLEVRQVFQVRKNRHVFTVELKDGSNLRLDIYNKKVPPKRRFVYQKLAYEKKINVPQLIDVFKVEKKLWRVSDWIEGVRVGTVWNLFEVFEKCGEQIAKLNLIKDTESDKYLGLADFNKLNLIWTSEKEIYIIDVLIDPRTYVDYSVVKTLVMGLRTRNRIDAFLKEYSRFRNIDRIMEILEKENNWKWKTFGLEKETDKDVLV